MTSEERVTWAKQVIADVIADLATAHHRADEAIAVLKAEGLRQDALELANQIHKQLRDLEDKTAEVRVALIGDIWEAEKMTLSALADKIGVSKARADQLVRAATGRPPQKRNTKKPDGDSATEE